MFSDKYKTHKYSSGQNVQLLNVKLLVHHVTGRLWKVKIVLSLNFGIKKRGSLLTPRNDIPCDLAESGGWTGPLSGRNRREAKQVSLLLGFAYSILSGYR